MTLAQLYILAEVEYDAQRNAQRPQQAQGSTFDVAQLAGMTLSG